ncbi:hypothetical protein JCM11672_19930 [Alkaliphilus crotonatoxidans]
MEFTGRLCSGKKAENKLICLKKVHLLEFTTEGGLFNFRHVFQESQPTNISEQDFILFGQKTSTDEFWYINCNVN